MTPESRPSGGPTGTSSTAFTGGGTASRPRPLAHLSAFQLRRLARRADRLRHHDVSRFADLADQHGITVRQLRLLADAWAEAGPCGVAALGPAPPEVPEHVMERALDIIETWRRRHFPLDALEVERWRNRITVRRVAPAADRAEPPVVRPLMQLRRTGDGRWHLYRKAAQGEWWPVTVRGRRRRQSLSACLDAVRIDLLNQFWVPEGRPIDLAFEDGPPWS